MSTLGDIGKAAVGPVGMALGRFALKGGVPGLLIRAAQDKKKPQPGAPATAPGAAPAAPSAGAATTVRKGGSVKKMAKGGPVKPSKDPLMPKSGDMGTMNLRKGGKCSGGMTKMAKGGAVRGDGCAKRGHTKGRMR